MKKANESLCCASDVAEATRPAYRRWKWEQEAFIVLLVDIKNKPIGKPIVVSVGTVGSVTVHPRDVFREAIRRNATAVIISHCHPSGSTTPSVDDTEITYRLVKAGELLGIKVLDHVIVSKKSHISMTEAGLM